MINNTTIFGELFELSKPRQKFLIQFFQDIFILTGKANFTNLSRYSVFCEKTFRRNYLKKWDFSAIAESMLKFLPNEEKIAAIDCSSIPKSGKKTWGLGWFWSGCANRAIKGLEVSCIALIGLRVRTAYAFSATQTDGKLQKKSRIDFYLKHVRDNARRLLKYTQYIAADGFYAKEKFIAGVLKEGFHIVSKLRCDANLRYLYKGEQKIGKGARRKYSGKYSGIDKRKFKMVGKIENGKILMYYADMYSISMKMIIRVVALQEKDSDTPLCLLFSTDLQLSAKKIYEYYTARFQIEFLFRDAKQHTGLLNCQSRKKEALDFHFNASLLAVNLVKMQLHSKGELRIDVPISIIDYKIQMTNQFLIDRIISMLGLNRKIVLNHPKIDQILNFGRMVA